MRNFKHGWKVAIAGAVLTGIFFINATTHRTIQAASPPVSHAVVVEAVATTPINAVESSGGGDVRATNKTDW